MPKIGTLPIASRNGLHGVVEDGRIARAVADEQAIGFVLENFRSAAVSGGRTVTLHAAIGKMTEDIILRPTIQGDDVQVRRRG